MALDILIVDDEQDIRDLVSGVLDDEGYGTRTAASADEALAALEGLWPDADWSAATALATHPRIAQAARETGFGRVIESRPGLDDVLRALESERSAP